MKIKLVTLIFPLFLVACSPSDDTANSSYEASATETREETSTIEESIEENNEVAYVEPTEEAQSEEKINFCDDAEDRDSCNCQFDVMDPILTTAIGSDWSTKSMEEKDFPIYVSAVEASVAQCP
jgi:hypothetical protein